MASFLKRNRLFFVLTLIFIVTEIFVNPLGNYPLNDDWCYTQILYKFYRTGEIFLGNWPAMTLCTQLLWGSAFVKLFGAGFFVLRLSTMVSALIGYAFLNRLVIQISGNRPLAFLACMVLMLNPMIFNLSNTFMTDVNFNTLLIICFYVIYHYFKTKKIIYYLCFVIVSVALVLLRQYGIIFPACFIVSCFFMKEKKWLSVVLGIISFAVVFITLKQYESYLSVKMPPIAMYKYSGSIDLMKGAFWNGLWLALTDRYNKSILQVLFYTVPFAIVFLTAAIKQIGIKTTLLLLLADGLVMCLIFNEKGLYTANMLMNMQVGPETFQGGKHNDYPRFDTFLFFAKLILSFTGLFVYMACLVGVTKKKLWPQFFRPGLVFFTLFVFAYTFMMLITTESYHDRYHIPFITVFIILLSYLARFYSVSLRLAVIPLLFWAWIAVLGTKDYLEWNTQRWRAYWYLRTEMKVPASRIVGGFEVNCWNEGLGWGWQDYFTLDKFDYMIQFRPEDGWTPIKEFKFQRYFPYKEDKIYIFAKDVKKNGH